MKCSQNCPFRRSDVVGQQLPLLRCNCPPCRCTCGTTLFASGTFRDVQVHTEDLNCWDYDLHESTTVPCPQPTAKVAIVTGDRTCLAAPEVPAIAAAVAASCWLWGTLSAC